MSVTLTFAGQSLELKRLQAQPFGYQGNSLEGLTYRAWEVTGLADSAEWLTLLSIYESWRVERFNETSTRVSREIGTTVSFSGSSFGVDWDKVKCWFAEPPSLDGDGYSFLQVGFQLIDAQGYLDVQSREEEQEGEESTDAIADNGTWTVTGPAGSTELTLTKNPDAYAAGPDLSRTAVGAVIVQGPLNAIRSKEIEGYTDEAGWGAVRSWYEEITSRLPITGEWYPADPPTMERSMVRKDGQDVTRCTIAFQLWEVV